MKSFFHFLQYNNALPIAIVVIFMATGSAFAATNPEVFVSSKQQVVSPDNTYVINTNISGLDFNLKILDIKEDGDLYYVTYSYTTIKSVDYVWQEIEVTETLKASKKELSGKDLGLFVARQLGELITQEKKYLALVQEQEQTKGKSEKVVVTEYSGLVGKFLDEKKEHFPGYKPVVDETVAEEEKDPVTAPNDGPSTVSYGAEPGVSPVRHLLTQADVEAFIEARVKELLAQQSLIATVEEKDDTEDNSDNTGGSGVVVETDPIGGGAGTTTTTPATTPVIQVPEALATSTEPQPEADQPLAEELEEEVEEEPKPTPEPVVEEPPTPSEVEKEPESTQPAVE